MNYSNYDEYAQKVAEWKTQGAIALSDKGWDRVEKVCPVCMGRLQELDYAAWSTFNEFGVVGFHEAYLFGCKSCEKQYLLTRSGAYAG